jgi:hypothetical protein
MTRYQRARLTRPEPAHAAVASLQTDCRPGVATRIKDRLNPARFAIAYSHGREVVLRFGQALQQLAGSCSTSCATIEAFYCVVVFLDHTIGFAFQVREKFVSFALLARQKALSFALIRL